MCILSICITIDGTQAKLCIGHSISFSSIFVFANNCKRSPTNNAIQLKRFVKSKPQNND